MADLKVDTLSETWRSVLDEIESQVAIKRAKREHTAADLRSLDRDLGAIQALEHLRHLAERQQEKPPEPIRGSGVRVPGVSHSMKATR